jgi:O-antigen ligase
LTWDLVQEHITRFSAATGQQFVSSLTVTAARTPTAARIATGARAEEIEMRERTPITPARAVLWRIAATEFADHPWLGIGLDNFRLGYGRHLGWTQWNQTIHTNNWYLETLVSAGLLGGLPFLGWLALLVIDIIRETRRAAAQPITLAIATGLVAYLVHGVLDYFLLFNVTGLLFWLLVALWVRATRGEEMATIGGGRVPATTPASVAIVARETVT